MSRSWISSRSAGDGPASAPPAGPAPLGGGTATLPPRWPGPHSPRSSRPSREGIFEGERGVYPLPRPSARRPRPLIHPPARPPSASPPLGFMAASARPRQGPAGPPPAQAQAQGGGSGGGAVRGAPLPPPPSSAFLLLLLLRRHRPGAARPRLGPGQTKRRAPASAVWGRLGHPVPVPVPAVSVLPRRCWGAGGSTRRPSVCSPAWGPPDTAPTRGHPPGRGTPRTQHLHSDTPPPPRDPAPTQ